MLLSIKMKQEYLLEKEQNDVLPLKILLVSVFVSNLFPRLDLQLINGKYHFRHLN